MEVLRTAVIATVLFTVSPVYIPAGDNGLAQVFFPWRANGSLIHVNGKTLGSELIGSRSPPPGISGAGNRQQVPSPTTLHRRCDQRGSVESLPCRWSAETDSRSPEVDSLNLSSIPVDLVTASASGLDPHISVAAALYQAPRVARARGISLQKINELVARETEGRTFGILGENRVNVLLLNAALDAEPSQSKGN